MRENIIEIKGLRKSFGNNEILRGIDLNIRNGEKIVIIGPSGCGKTTTLRTISGVIKPASGSVRLGGLELTGYRACKIARSGVNMSPEGRLIFNGLTVEENLRVGAYCLKSKAEVEANMRRALDLFPRLEERMKQQASTLSGGEQQMLAIARALMARPRILLLDEPSLGLAPLVIKDIFKTLQEIRSAGTTILIVEQNALATLKIADSAYVLELGKISMSGKADVLIHDERLIEAYLGNKKDQ